MGGGRRVRPALTPAQRAPAHWAGMPPPGANGTTSVIDRAGHATWARAAPARKGTATAPARMARRAGPVFVFIATPSFVRPPIREA